MRKVLIGSVVGLVAVFFSIPAFAQAEATSSTNMGLNAGLKIAYASPSKVYDADGKSVDIEGVSYSSMLINLGLSYDFAAMVPGLFAGLDLPIVRNSVTPDGGDAVSSMGMGDLSVYAGYLFPAIPDQLKVGGKLRFKAATGKSPYDELKADELSLGSGFNNIQISAIADGNFSGVKVGLDAGYLMTMGTDIEYYQGVKLAKAVPVNPGDFIYADISGGYTVNNMITPKLHVIYASSGDTSIDGTATKDTGSSWMALALDVDIKVNDMISAYVGWTAPMDASGMNLPNGFTLSGKNTMGGVMNFAVGATGTF